MKKNLIADKLNSSIKIEVEKVLPSKDKFDFADTILNKAEIKDSIEEISEELSRPQTKMVGFTFTENDITLLQKIKEHCLDLRIEMNRSEILRAAILLISELNDEQLEEACKRVEKLIPGRRKG